MNEIAVIGVSSRFSFSDNMQQLHKQLLNASSFENRMAMAGLRGKLLGIDGYEDVCGEVSYIKDIDKFDYKFFEISKKEARNMSPEMRLSMECSVQTILDAGYSIESFRGSNCGVIIAQSNSNYKGLLKDKDGISYVGNLRAMTTGNIAYYLDLQGPNMVIDTTCSSSLTAIHEAVNSLSNMETDYMLVGGVELALLKSKEDINEVKSLGIFSKDGICRPFDEDASGTVPGEGCGFVLLKRLDEAKRDRNYIYGVIKGSAINGNGCRSQAATSPSAIAQEEVIKKAWARAGVTADEITEIETHGTATKVGDPIEIEAIVAALSERKCGERVAIGSFKSNVGHLGNASGIASVIKVLCGFQNQMAYPIANYSLPNKKIASALSVVEPLKEARIYGKADRRVVGVSSFGFSGTNAHIVLENYAEKIVKNDIVDEVNRRVKISAKSSEAISRNAKAYSEFFKDYDGDINDAIYTLNTGRDDYRYYTEIECENREQLIDEFARLAIDAEGGVEETDLREWNNHYGEIEYNKVSLPGYSFEKNSVWSEKTEVIEAKKELSADEQKLIDLWKDYFQRPKR
jgi:acyl transferase domain-containing protein